MNNYEHKLLAFIKIIRILHKNVSNDVEKAIAIKFICDYLHNLKPIFTGLVSSEARNLPYNKMTNDHFFSRTQTAKKIFDFLDKDKITDKRLILFIKSRCRVHRVTKNENMNLRKIMNNRANIGIHWRKAYDMLGIKLVKYEKQSKKYIYKIENIDYSSTIEVSKKYNVSLDTVYYRCKSNSEKFSNWVSILI